MRCAMHRSTTFTIVLEEGPQGCRAYGCLPKLQKGWSIAWYPAQTLALKFRKRIQLRHAHKFSACLAQVVAVCTACACNVMLCPQSASGACSTSFVAAHSIRTGQVTNRSWHLYHNQAAVCHGHSMFIDLSGMSACQYLNPTSNSYRWLPSKT